MCFMYCGILLPINWYIPIADFSDVIGQSKLLKSILGLTVDTIVVCPARAYCPAGSSSPTYCPRGSTSLSVGQIASHVCEPCARSMYCPSAGSRPITCSSGHYCPTGTYSPIPCPAGTYGDSEGYYTVGQCRNCTVGHYCASGSSSPTPCSTGTYMPFSGSRYAILLYAVFWNEQ